MSCTCISLLFPSPENSPPKTLTKICKQC
jgi:hypothetical protein